MIVFNSSAPMVRGRNSEEMFSVDTVDELGSGSVDTDTGTYDDIDYETQDTTGAEPNYRIDVFQTGETITPYFKSNNESVSTVDQDGHVSYVADGESDVEVIVAGRGKKRVQRTLADGSADFTMEATDNSSGSLGAHCAAQIDAMLGTAGDDEQVFWSSHNGDYSSPSATINPNLFAGSLDLSSISVFRSTQGNDGVPLTLVTAQHCLYAKHISVPIGSSVVFKYSDGTYHTRTVSSKQGIDNADLAVAYLNAPLTGDYTIMKTVPADWVPTYAPSLILSNLQANISAEIMEARSCIPVLRKSMHNASGVGKSWLSVERINALSVTNPESILRYGKAFYDSYQYPDMEDWRAESLPGDSSGPIFLVVSGEPVLVSVMFSYTYTADIGGYVSEINSAMDDLAGADPGTYTLTHPNLSSYTDYS